MSKLPDPEDILARYAGCYSHEVTQVAILGDDALTAIKEYGRQVRDITLQEASIHARAELTYEGTCGDDPDPIPRVNKESILKLKDSEQLSIK
jgi:hypothetical protein